MREITSRSATPDDLREFYPDETCSFRAWVVEMDGHPEAIVGVALTRPIASLFSTVRDAMAPHLNCMTVLRAIKKAQAAVMDCKTPVWAVCDPTLPTSPKLLERLGFEYFGEVDGDTIYARSAR